MTKHKDDEEYSCFDEGETATYYPAANDSDDNISTKILTAKQGQIKIKVTPQTHCIQKEEKLLNLSGTDLAQLLSLNHTFVDDDDDEITFSGEEINIIQALQKELTNESECSSLNVSSTLMNSPIRDLL